MAEVVIMPKLGFNMDEGKLVEWYKKEGESVKKGEPLFSIETDKTNMDIEAVNDGVVRKLLINEGDKIPVTLPICIIGTADENIDAVLADAIAQLGGNAPAADTAAAVSAAPAAAAAPAPAAAPVAANVKKDGERIFISPRARRVAAENGIDIADLNIEGTGWDGGICEKDVLDFIANGPAVAKVKSTAVARAMAAENGVDLASVAGTGAGGRVMAGDVAAASKPAAPAAAAAPAADAEKQMTPDGKVIKEIVPYKGIRKVIGDRLAQSKFTAPHLYFTQKVNLEKLLELRKQVNAAQDQKCSVTDFIAKATIICLKKFPEINSSLVGENIEQYETVNLGIAVAAPSGLIVPNLKHSENMSVVEIAKTSSGLFEKARKGKLSLDEYTGGTFTISNLGMFGIENFTAIINPPEVAIMAISSTKDEPWVVTNADGTKEIAIKPVMNIQLTVDHRVIDGLLASQFVTEVKRLLENPIELLLN